MKYIFLIIAIALISCHKENPQPKDDIYKVDLHFKDTAYLDHCSIQINREGAFNHTGTKQPDGSFILTQQWDTSVIVHSGDTVKYIAVSNSSNKLHIPDISIDYKGKTDHGTRYADRTARGTSVMP